MTRPVRVALLSPVFWPEVRRGAERFLRELADGLIERGHEPRLITSHRGARKTTVEDGLPVIRVRRPPGARFAEQTLRVERHLTHVPGAYRSLVHGDDDIVHAVYPSDALAAARWTARTGRPSIHAWMGIPTDAWIRARRLRPPVVRAANNGCTVLTALSQAAADAVEDMFGIEPRVMPPGVNVDTFAPCAERSEHPTIFCGAAIEQPQKRVPLLLSAFSLVRRKRPEAKLLLSRPRDEQLAASVADSSAGIELVDVDEREALARCYSSAWVSVLPSLDEAFGLVLVEALACGTPVVGSDLGGISEIIDRDTIGRLFAGEDEEALARALLETLELTQTADIRETCRERAQDFSTERCVQRHEQLYMELLCH